MHSALQALLSLQEIDRDIYRVRQELRRLPAERDVRREALEKRTQSLETLTGEIRTMRVRVKEIEDHATVQRQRQRKVEGEAQSSRQDMALLAAFEHEIRTIKRDVSKSEEEALELLEVIEANEADRETRRQVLDAARAEFEEYSANVDAEIAAAEARLAELRARREARLSGALKREEVALYSRLLEARDGEAMAMLEGRICQGCYMQIPQNLSVQLARGASLVQCPSCDRILYPAT
jgi:predicted  nucleic acid-binding Zn-ribbon protein